jgi:hypothetical protein
VSGATSIELIFGASGGLSKVAADVARVLDLHFKLRENTCLGGDYDS